MNMSSVHRLFLMVFTLAFCLASSACDSRKINKENYDKLNLEMTMKDVQGILGEGTRQGDPSSGMAAQVGVNLAPAGNRAEIYLWESGKKSITLHFVGDKLKYKTSAGF